MPKKIVKRPGEFVRAGEKCRYRYKDAEGNPGKVWAEVTVIGVLKSGGFQVVGRYGGSTYWASAGHFESYTGVYYAGYTLLTDEELAYLARPALYGRPQFDVMHEDIRRYRRALESGELDPISHKAIEHDLKLYERLLNELERGRELSESKLKPGAYVALRSKRSDGR
jgi:hypothetical protein